MMLPATYAREGLPRSNAQMFLKNLITRASKAEADRIAEAIQGSNLRHRGFRLAAAKNHRKAEQQEPGYCIVRDKLHSHDHKTKARQHQREALNTILDLLESLLTNRL